MTNQFPIQLEREGAEVSIRNTTGIVLSNFGKKYEKQTEISGTLCARDYKGFSAHNSTAVMEWKK